MDSGLELGGDFGVGAPRVQGGVTTSIALGSKRTCVLPDSRSSEMRLLLFVAFFVCRKKVSDAENENMKKREGAPSVY